MPSIVAKLLVYVLIAYVAMSPAQAEDVTEADKARFQSVISSQIEAFRDDDGALAFSFAAPSIKGKFQSVETFMTMVRRGYRPVYRPRTVKFGAVTDELGVPTQTVHIVGPNGRGLDRALCHGAPAGRHLENLGGNSAQRRRRRRLGPIDIHGYGVGPRLQLPCFIPPQASSPHSDLTRESRPQP